MWYASYCKVATTRPFVFHRVANNDIVFPRDHFLIRAREMSLMLEYKVRRTAPSHSKPKPRVRATRKSELEADGTKEIDKPAKPDGGQPICIRFQKLSFRPEPVATYTVGTIQEPIFELKSVHFIVVCRSKSTQVIGGASVQA